MKKILIVIMCFILVGCTNSISLDFNSKVDADVKFSFTASEFIKHQGSEEYAEYNNAEIAEEIEAIINEARPIKDNYDELFEEVKYDSKDDKFEGEYKYKYTYDDFVNNTIFTKCFEYSAVEEVNNSLYVYLKGKSDCAPLELRVKASGRMVSDNANKKSKGEYIWEVKEKDNDIQFKISRSRKISKLFSFSNFFYIILAVGAVFGIIYLNKKTKKQ